MIADFHPKLRFSRHVYDPNGHIFNCPISSLEYLLLNDAVVGSPSSMSAEGNILILWMLYQRMKKGAAAPYIAWK